MFEGELVDVERAAQLLSVSDKTVRRLIDRGDLAAFNIGGPGRAVRISLVELQRALSSWETRGGPSPGGSTR